MNIIVLPLLEAYEQNTGYGRQILIFVFHSFNHDNKTFAMRAFYR